MGGLDGSSHQSIVVVVHAQEASASCAKLTPVLHHLDSPDQHQAKLKARPPHATERMHARCSVVLPAELQKLPPRARYGKVVLREDILTIRQVIRKGCHW